MSITRERTERPIQRPRSNQAERERALDHFQKTQKIPLGRPLKVSIRKLNFRQCLMQDTCP